MDEALFFSLQLEKFPGHEATMRQFAEANGIPFDLELIYQLIDARKRDDQRLVAAASSNTQTQDDTDCLGHWRSYLNDKFNHPPSAIHRHQTLQATQGHSEAVLEETELMIAVVARRKALRLTQTEFARRLGVNVRTYQDWEQGRRQPSEPSEAMLRRSL